MKIKVEASGWPNKNYENNEHMQQNFVKNYEDLYGIKIDPKNISFNAGLRSLSKLLVNILYNIISKFFQMSKQFMGKILHEK